MTEASRLTPPMTELFRRDADIPMMQIRSVEGETRGQLPTMKILMATPDMNCLKIYRKKGELASRHAHMDHSTICCLLSGKVKLFIGDQTFIAEAGDVWRHPPGVVHQTEALEDSIQIEVKSPACKTW
ncbi:MAG TPA: cupin domain-containing protein [Pseudolabrys sp.]|nr:cupin domain-containing protein [Pseudolabrys sp.]HZT24087.1 cupin domain-containing protein [Pseudolabrys sp.]